MLGLRPDHPIERHWNKVVNGLELRVRSHAPVTWLGRITAAGALAVFYLMQKMNELRQVDQADLGLSAIITIIVVVIALAAAIFLLTPSSTPDQDGPDPASLDDFQITTATEERVEPLLFGTRLNKGLNLIWYGDLFSKAIKEETGSGKETQSVIVGYAYFLSMLYAGPKGRCKLIEFRRDNDKRKSFDTVTGPGGQPGLPQSSDPSPEIGIFKAMTGKKSDTYPSKSKPTTIYFGTGDHSSSDFVNFSEGAFWQDQVGGTDMFMKTRSYLFMPKAFIGDNVTSVPPYAAVMRRTRFAETDLNRSELNDVDGIADANPAHVIFSILKDELGVPASLLETGGAAEGSFQVAADTLDAENMGVSFMMERARTAKDWIKEVERHADATLFFNRVTGKYNIRLIRDDYDPDLLNVVGEDLWRDLRFQRRGWEDTFTDLEVKWTSREHWDERTQNIVNDASRANLNYKKKRLVAFPMFTHPDAITPVLARLKRRYFFPSAAARFKISLKAYRARFGEDLNPGDVIKLDIPSEGATGFIMRVMSVGGAKSTDQRSDIECVEDIFGLGNVSVESIPEGEFVPIDYEIVDPPNPVVVKDALAELTIPSIDDEVNTLMVAASPHLPAPLPPVNEPVQFGFNASAKTTAGVDPEQIGVTHEFDGYAQLRTALTSPGLWLDDATVVFEIKKANSLVLPAALTRGDLQRMALIAVIDDGSDSPEVISIQTMTQLPDDVTDGRIFQVTGVIRGIAATGRHTFAIGSDVWFPTGGLAGVALIKTPITGGFVEFEGFNQLDVGPEVEEPYTYGFRAQTPYPAHNLTGERIGGVDTKLNWHARKRTFGARQFVAENLTACDDIGEGQWEITGTGGFGPVFVDANAFTARDTRGFLIPPSFTRVAAPAGVTYTIRSFLNGRYSDPEQVTV